MNRVENSIWFGARGNVWAPTQFNHPFSPLYLRHSFITSLRLSHVTRKRTGRVSRICCPLVSLPAFIHSFIHFLIILSLSVLFSLFIIHLPYSPLVQSSYSIIALTPRSLLKVTISNPAASAACETPRHALASRALRHPISLALEFSHYLALDCSRPASHLGSPTHTYTYSLIHSFIHSLIHDKHHRSCGEQHELVSPLPAHPPPRNIRHGLLHKEQHSRIKKPGLSATQHNTGHHTPTWRPRI